MLPHFVIVTRRVLTVVSEPAVPVDDGVYHVVRYIRTGDNATLQVRYRGPTPMSTFKRTPVF